MTQPASYPPCSARTVSHTVCVCLCVLTLITCVCVCACVCGSESAHIVSWSKNALVFSYLPWFSPTRQFAIFFSVPLTECDRSSQSLCAFVCMCMCTLFFFTSICINVNNRLVITKDLLNCNHQQLGDRQAELVREMGRQTVKS